MNNKKSRIHVWVPDLFSTTGGIQAFSRYLIDALSIEAEIKTFIKNDLPGSKLTPNGYIACYGKLPLLYRSQVFALSCLSHAFKEKPDLIISTHLHFGPVASLIRQCLRIPYVLVAHGIDAWYLNRASRIKALQKADLVMSVSRYTRDQLVLKAGLDASHIKILPNTFDSDKYTICKRSPVLFSRYNLTPENQIILTVCRLAEAERYKGYDLIIKAMPKILQAVPTARYLLVGTGPDRPRIEKMIADVGVQDTVILTGFVSESELAEHYNLCDLFAMPSKAEGFGIVYLEALGCGKPVLAGNKDGSRDALADGELGVLVDPENVNAVAESIVEILEHRSPHPLIYQPKQLRMGVIKRFGFTSFQKTLHQHLAPLLSAS